MCFRITGRSGFRPSPTLSVNSLAPHRDDEWLRIPGPLDKFLWNIGGASRVIAEAGAFPTDIPMLLPGSDRLHHQRERL